MRKPTFQNFTLGMDRLRLRVKGYIKEFYGERIEPFPFNESWAANRPWQSVSQYFSKHPPHKK